MKIYIHSIKITLYLIKYMFNYTTFLCNIKIYFYSIKINLYSIKYIFIITTFFHDIKIYLYLIKINLYSPRNILSYIFFHISKIYFYYMNISLNTFLVSIYGLPFVSTRARILLSVCKLSNGTRM